MPVRPFLRIVVHRRETAPHSFFGDFLFSAYFFIGFGFMHRTALMGLAAAVIAFPTFVGAYRYSDRIEKPVPYMGMNVAVNILTPFLVAIGF